MTDNDKKSTTTTTIKTQWPTIERDAKDQIREKKIRCAFLPLLGHEITQIKEEELEATPSPSSHITFSDSVNNNNTVPASPVRQVAQQPLSVHTTTSSSADMGTLKRELESAQETIHNLQSSVERLQREATSVSVIRMSHAHFLMTPSYMFVDLIHAIFSGGVFARVCKHATMHQLSLSLIALQLTKGSQNLSLL